MKILRIGGKNLASLAGEFCVDFEQEPLASSGLFAISGPTGAGKSTLLDALCLALYDATPRMAKSSRSTAFLPDVGSDTVSPLDPRTLLRRGAGEAHAEVDFVGNDQLRYRARWSVRRSRGKAGGGLQKSAMTLHRLPELIALGGTKTEVLLEIEKCVGLTFEQFTRAVLLAQNEFSAFLKTEENEKGALLETLTGSAIYSAISRRASERFKAEQAAMQQLNTRLADQTPLSAEARAGIEAQSAAAEAVLAASEERKTALERQLRWRQQADKLRHDESQAEAALALASAALEAAAGRRRRLDTLAAVQPARQVLAEGARIGREAAGIGGALDAATADLARARSMQEQAGAALAGAAAQLHAAEQAQRGAAPDLDQAKALDASIDALAPSHAKSLEARIAADGEVAQAAAALQDKSAELAATRSAQEAGAAWLAQHAQLENLALQWQRWDALMAQAEQGTLLEARLAAQLDAASAALDAAARADRDAAAAQSASAATLAEREEKRQKAIAALAGFDGDQLRGRRAALESRRDSLASAERTWTELAQTRSRLQQAASQASAIAAAKTGASAALEAAAAQMPALDAALAQSERSLKAAELACADSVADLRATLADGEPCPVCGGAEHPYQHRDALLHDMLGSLRAQVARCRAQQQEKLSEQAAQRAAAAHSERQLLDLKRDAGELETALDRLGAAWQALAVSAEAPADTERSAWIAAQLDALKDESRRLDAQERAARDAAKARDAAQHDCDRSAAEHARAQELAAASREALARAAAAHAALADKSMQAKEIVARQLDELAAAFTAQPGWREQWRAGAPAFRAAREAEAALWREQSAAQARRGAAAGALETGQAAAAARHVQAQQANAGAAAEHARIDAAIRAMRARRAALWEGRAVADVERQLAAAVGVARAAVAAQQAASLQAAQAETRARESMAQLETRRAALRRQHAGAEQQLAAWLAGYADRHPELEALAGRAALDELLATGEDWIAQERRQLQGIDGAAASAATVLAERRGQRERHLQSGEAGESGADALGAALDALLAERKAALDAAGALRLQLAQDNVRRENARAMMAEIEKQQLVELRWSRMNELIGSADGKKFRNYAQQFTLDVLLGYANSHLGHLARRYRLERVVAAGGPSLGLLVRDQDMGGEIRSVNSLSGGESFLVSLALALGLASLSSNRVRVESLFIDEGFGSLDSDTLRVAMDALDGLQSMGRKVGVISHVQEMTERISTRIVVQPSGGGTSSVTVQ